MGCNVPILPAHLHFLGLWKPELCGCSFFIVVVYIYVLPAIITDDTAKMNITIAILSALATIAAAIIYYYTLHELKRQRENTYRPHLFIDNIFFYVQAIRKGDKMFPSKWGENSNVAGTFINFDPESYWLTDFSLKCYNIGFGTAKKIDIKFIYDIDSFISQISDIGKHVSPELLITVKKEGYFVSFDCKNKDIPFSNKSISIDGVMTQYLSYVLPVNIKSEHSSIKLPLHYLELLNVYVFLFSSIKDKKEKGIDIDIPIITTEITYLDISNKQFSKNMTITAEMSMFSTAGFSGQFKIHEIE